MRNLLKKIATWIMAFIGETSILTGNIQAWWDRIDSDDILAALHSASLYVNMSDAQRRQKAREWLQNKYIGTFKIPDRIANLLIEIMLQRMKILSWPPQPKEPEDWE